MSEEKYGFADEDYTFKNMTVEQAEDVQSKIAEFDLPFFLEYGWIIEFPKVRGVELFSRTKSVTIWLHAQ